MSWGEYWTERIILEVDWKGRRARIEIDNPQGGGLNNYSVNVNGWGYGRFLRYDTCIDGYFFNLFYSDDLLVMVDLINEKNGQNLPFGNFYQLVASRRRR